MGYIRGRKRKNRTEETKGESPRMVRFASVTGKEGEALELSDMYRGKEKSTFFSWK